MEAAEALHRLGGIGTASAITQLATRRSLRRAMRRGEVRKVSRGRFVLADLESDRLSAAQVGGVVSHLSAAVAHGWEVKSRPQLAWVTVRRNAHPSPEAQATRHISFAHCQPDEVDNGVTRPLRTVLDCARSSLLMRRWRSQTLHFGTARSR